MKCKWFAYGTGNATITPSTLASLKSRMVLPFWYWLTQVVLKKGLLKSCSVVVLEIFQDIDMMWHKQRGHQPMSVKSITPRHVATCSGVVVEPLMLNLLQIYCWVWC